MPGSLQVRREIRQWKHSSETAANRICRNDSYFHARVLRQDTSAPQKITAKQRASQPSPNVRRGISAPQKKETNSNAKSSCSKPPPAKTKPCTRSIQRATSSPRLSPHSVRVPTHHRHPLSQVHRPNRTRNPGDRITRSPPLRKRSWDRRNEGVLAEGNRRIDISVARGGRAPTTGRGHGVSGPAPGGRLH